MSSAARTSSASKVLPFVGVVAGLGLFVFLASGDVGEQLKIAGVPLFAAVVVLGLGGAALALGPRGAAIAGLALPWLAGALASGWQQWRGLRALVAVGPADKLAMLAEVMSEAQTVRVLGASLSAGLALLVAAAAAMRVRGQPEQAPVCACAVVAFGAALGDALAGSGVARELAGAASTMAADPLALALAGSGRVHAGMLTGAAIAGLGVLGAVVAAFAVKGARPAVAVAALLLVVPLGIDQAALGAGARIAAEVPPGALPAGVHPVTAKAGERVRTRLVAFTKDGLGARDVSSKTPLLIDVDTPAPAMRIVFAGAKGAGLDGLTIAADRRADPAALAQLSDTARALFPADAAVALPAHFCTGAGGETSFALDDKATAQKLVDALYEGACVAP